MKNRRKNKRIKLAVISAIILTILGVGAKMTLAQSKVVSSTCTELTVVAHANYEGENNPNSNTANNVLTVLIDDGAPQFYGFGASGITVTIPWDKEVAHTYIVDIDANRFNGGKATEFDTRDEGVSTACPSQPADKVVTTEWVDGTYPCGDATVTQTRKTTTYTYTWDGNKWNEKMTVTDEIRTRPLTPAEVEKCTLETTTTTTIVVETTATTAAPPVTVATDIPPVPTVPPATQLPETGTTSAVLIVIALIVLVTGFTLLYLRKREDEMIDQPVPNDPEDTLPPV